ncbi:carboxypeptidase-like regulatory domain-containing protein [Gelidibacter japonicus]|uniref:carboxypeptidase-like regulatory domain-containing protein n=1 Tax=Gelidibacter japonicus TaxID=1962232 RepID=UPI003A935B84
MGRNVRKKERLAYLILFLCIGWIGFAQTQITGRITQNNNLPITGANVLLKDSTSTFIIGYSFSNINGIYELSTTEIGHFELSFASLGFKTQTLPIEIKTNQKALTIDVTLKEEPTDLDEVIISVEKPISVSKDTITFKIKYFTNGTEQTVEDLLKKIPGLSIDSDGTIKVGNQEIEKLMIDGDDLFEKGYKILSKNMPAYPIEEVEILKHYSNNRLLKNIEESNKVALNLKLDEKSKRIWFGNVDLDIGRDEFYQIKGNLMNFGKNNKYYFLVNGNSIGYDATVDIQQLINPMHTDEPASIGDNKKVDNMLNLSAESLNFKRSRINFNNTELASLNAIFNPTEKLKIKPLGFFNWTKTNFYRNKVDDIHSNDTRFINIEDYKLHNKNKVAFGKVDVTYDISNTKMLEAVTKYNYGNFDDGSNLIFNGNSTIENLKYKNSFFDQKISYTNKFNDHKVLILTGRFIHEKTPQNYNIDQFFYDTLFPNFSNANNVRQQSTNQMQFAGFNAHLLDRKPKGHLLELQFGNEYRQDQLNTKFSILDNETVIDTPQDYKNQLSYLVSDLYLKTKYRYKLGSFALTGKVDFHQLFNTLKVHSISTNQSPFFLNPSIGFDWKINQKNFLIATFSNTTTNAKILDIYNNSVLTGFRSFSKGTGNFDQLDASSIMLNYQLGSWTDQFFANMFVLYSKNYDFYSTNTLIEQNHTQSQKIVTKNREFISINPNINYYFKSLSSNLKMDLGYTKGEFKNSVNNSNLRRVISSSYKYGLELRSSFKGIFNYHIGTKWTTNRIETTIDNSFTDNISFLDLSFVFNENLNAKLQSERYFFGNLNGHNAYYFLDMATVYQLNKNKLSIGITGRNLFNTKTFRNSSISDIGSSTTEYKLLPRSVLLKLEYRF